jgi:L-ascorbate metabolism protein UlaG (beta-lactamase superfamily)
MSHQMVDSFKPARHWYLYLIRSDISQPASLRASTLRTYVPVDAEPTSRLTGEPVGFIIRSENGFTVYHPGDTAVMSDMKIFANLYQPNLALLPIGSNFTMDPAEAAYACKLLRPQFVVPMHYGTWPLLTGTVEEFGRILKDQPEVKLIPITPGQTIE